MLILSFPFFPSSIAGKANLEKSDLEPALRALKDRLMTKNVVCFSLTAFFSNFDSQLFYTKFYYYEETT